MPDDPKIKATPASDAQDDRAPSDPAPVDPAADGQTPATRGPADVLPDPFDPARLALKGNPADAIGVKRLINHVPVRKPNSQEFFRAHPDPAFRNRMAILELKAEREFYAFTPEVASALPGESGVVMLTTCVNRQGNVFLWPVKLPREDGRQSAWHTTAIEAVTLAESKWIRVVANMNAQSYDVFEAVAPLNDPEWPDHSLRDLLRVAFGGGRLVDTLEHAVVRQLLGQV